MTSRVFVAAAVAALLFVSATDGFSRTIQTFSSRPTSIHRHQSAVELTDRIVKLQSNSYIPDERVMRAIASTVNKKVTVADIASISGTDLFKTKQELTKIAALTAGELSVSNDGDICYTFDSNFKETLSSKSNAVKLNAIYKKAKPFLFYLLRISFGVMLLSSIVIVWTAIFSATSSSSNNKESDDRRNNRGGLFGGGFFGPSPFDILYYSRPYGYYNSFSPNYYQTPEEYNESNKQISYRLSLLESFFSFVFGDGDPNSRLEEAQLRAAAKVIRDNKGVVIAEQLAPFVDPPSASSSSLSTLTPFSSSDSSSVIVDEKCVLPIVTKLGGVPVPSPDGDIVYTFEELMTTTAEFRDDDFESREKSKRRSDVLLEQKQIFSLAEPTNQFIAGGLGVVNLVGVVKLFSILGTNGLLPAPQYFFLLKAFPLLAAYSVLYVAIPAFRYVAIQKENSLIEERNNRRSEWAAYLKENQGKVSSKLGNLKKLFAVGTKILSNNDYFYSTKNDAVGSGGGEFDEFDKKLKG